jgi:hypothetical protein
MDVDGPVKPRLDFPGWPWIAGEEEFKYCSGAIQIAFLSRSLRWLRFSF